MIVDSGRTVASLSACMSSGRTLSFEFLAIFVRTNSVYIYQSCSLIVYKAGFFLSSPSSSHRVAISEDGTSEKRGGRYTSILRNQYSDGGWVPPPPVFKI